MNSIIKEKASEIEAELIRLRRELHKNPELSFCEETTKATLLKYMDKWKINYNADVFKTGICALIDCKKEKTLLIRADMDALPIFEETGLSYKSQNNGVMHACGHDVHMATVLGATYVLNELKDKLSCNVKIIFQPGEEDTGGALPMIEAGVLEAPCVTSAISLHVSNEVDAGKICLKKGAVMASPDDFDLEISGKGGHGAYPEKCVNPILVASEIIKKFDELYKSHEGDCVISVCKLSGGSFYNIIPDNIVLGGTVRAFSEELRKELAEKMGKISGEICASCGAKSEFDYRFRYPPLICDDDAVESFCDSAKDILGSENVFYTDIKEMTGEDFAYFSQRVPSVFFKLGTKNEAIGAKESLHSSKFIVDEKSIKVGVMAIARYALYYGKN